MMDKEHVFRMSCESLAASLNKSLELLPVLSWNIFAKTDSFASLYTYVTPFFKPPTTNSVSTTC